MKSQRKAGTILSYVLMAVNILSSLIYTPIMLRILGQSEYGLYQLCYSVISYLSILNLGFTSAYMRFYSRYKVKNEEAEIARLNGMYMTIFLIISVITVLAGSVMVMNVRSIFSTGLTDSEITTSKILMGFMVFNMALSFPLGCFSSILSAHEEFIIQRAISILIRLLNPFLTLPLLLLGYGSVGMVLITTVLTVSDFIFEASFCIIKLHSRFIFRGFRISMFKELGMFTFWIFLMNIVGQVNWNLDKILLGRMVGTVPVAVYGIGNTIYQMYQYSPCILANIFTPKINILVATSGKEREVSDIFIRVGRIQYLILALILTGFTFFGKQFIYIWLGGGYENSYYVALLLMYSATIPFMQNLGIEIQTAKNMHQMRSVVYTLIAVLNVAISIPFIMLWGAAGAALGTAVALILGNVIFMNVYYQKKIGLDIIGFWKNIIRMTWPMLFPVMFGIAYVKIVDMYVSILNLLMGIILYTLVYVFFVWKLSMNAYEKNLITSITSKVFKNR